MLEACELSIIHFCNNPYWETSKVNLVNGAVKIHFEYATSSFGNAVLFFTKSCVEMCLGFHGVFKFFLRYICKKKAD